MGANLGIVGKSEFFRGFLLRLSNPLESGAFAHGKATMALDKDLLISDKVFHSADSHKDCR